MRRVIGEDEFDRLFEDFEHTAYRLENREEYVKDPDEAEPHAFVAFREGRPEYDWFKPWQSRIQRLTGEGKIFERVRVVSEPHSEYTRFSLDLARLNVEAGEDIRYLPRPRAQELGLPDEDYWLFDSRVALIFHYGPDGRLTESELVDDPDVILQRNIWRDVAQHYAIPRNEYAAGS